MPGRSRNLPPLFLGVLNRVKFSQDFGCPFNEGLDVFIARRNVIAALMRPKVWIAVTVQKGVIELLRIGLVMVVGEFNAHFGS
jgi:hypothetical protein